MAGQERAVPAPRAASGRGRPTYRELEQRERRMKILLQDMEERQQSLSDSEGVFGKPAILVGLEKNFANVIREINWLNGAAHKSHPNDPGGPELGFWGAVSVAHIRISAGIQAIAVFDRQHPNLVRDLHRVLGVWLSPPLVFKLLRPDYQGSRERMALAKAFQEVVWGNAVPWVFSTAHEIETIPIEGERKAPRS